MTSSRAEAYKAGRVRILGLDPSLTSFGVSKVEMSRGGMSFTYRTDVLKTSTKGVTRLKWFYLKMQELVRDFAPDIIVLEGYAYGVARGNSAISMGELGGIIRFALSEVDAAPVIVPPAKLKKFVTGKGNAGKDIVLLELYKRFEVDVPTSDEGDATGLALMAAVGLYDLNVVLPKANLDALKDVEWPASREDDTPAGV